MYYAQKPCHKIAAGGVIHTETHPIIKLKIFVNLLNFFLTGSYEHRDRQSIAASNLITH